MCNITHFYDNTYLYMYNYYELEDIIWSLGQSQINRCFETIWRNRNAITFQKMGCVSFKFTKFISRNNISWKIYKDENFILRYLEKICLVNFIIFLGTIQIGIIIGHYIWIYSHLHGNFIPNLFFGKFFLFPWTFYTRE